MEILLSRETKQILGQRMYQSMSLLQMGIEELEAYMHELSLENPLIDEKPRKADSYIASSGCGRIRMPNGRNLELPIPDKVRNTLKMSLNEQVRFLHLPESTAAALRLLPRSPKASCRKVLPTRKNGRKILRPSRMR